MKERKYEDISICDLCKKDGVSRMAFYNNYKTLDAVIKNIVSDVNNKIIKEIGSPFRSNINLNWCIKVFKTI